MRTPDVGQISTPFTRPENKLGLPRYGRHVSVTQRPREDHLKINRYMVVREEHSYTP